MLELPEPSSSTPVPFDPRTVDDRSDADLDALPFGVVGLDAEGTILRYNLYESRFARIDRNQVLGRHFFEEVARCTRTESFQGRFRAFVGRSGEGAPQVERFDFLFDFAFGAQDVSVEIVRAPAAPRFYLLINRKKVSGPRPDFPPDLLAIRQRDLAPDEALHGVRRDDLERRLVEAPLPLFSALRATCDRLAPETWQLFATEWGLHWGRRVAVDLEASALESSGRSLRELTMRDVSQRISAYFSDRGWGSPLFDFSATAEGLILVEIDRSALAEAASPTRRSSGAPSGDRACHLAAGCLAGILSSVADRRLTGREFACVAGGAPRCAIVILAHERRRAADAAIGEGARTVEALRLALRRAPRSAEASR
ncbi:MAG: 4-vinyl reductase [Minicystis sp.]